MADKVARVGLTGFYKYSGAVSAAREYVRLVNRVAETQPEDVSDEMINEMGRLRNEVEEVIAFMVSVKEKHQETPVTA